MNHHAMVTRAIYAQHLSGPQHTVGPWQEAFGQTEAMALRALAERFRALRS